MSHVQLSAATTRQGLRLLCLLVPSRNGQVLARCAGHRQAYALRPALGSVRDGGMSHAL